MEKLRDEFARETDPAKQKAIAEAVQVRDTEVTTHLYLGQWYQPGASRKNVSGYLTAPGAGVLERREEGLLTSPKRTGRWARASPTIAHALPLPEGEVETAEPSG